MRVCMCQPDGMDDDGQEGKNRTEQKRIKNSALGAKRVLIGLASRRVATLALR